MPGEKRHESLNRNDGRANSTRALRGKGQRVGHFGAMDMDEIRPTAVEHFCRDLAPLAFSRPPVDFWKGNVVDTSFAAEALDGGRSRACQGYLHVGLATHGAKCALYPSTKRALSQA